MKSVRELEMKENELNKNLKNVKLFFVFSFYIAFHTHFFTPFSHIFHLYL